MIRSCSQTRPGICSRTRPGISLCSLYGLSLQGRGQFLVLLNQSKQDREPLSALALDCLCPTGLTSWSVTLFSNRTILNILPLCKVMFPGSLLPLSQPQCVHKSNQATTRFQGLVATDCIEVGKRGILHSELLLNWTWSLLEVLQ